MRIGSHSAAQSYAHWVAALSETWSAQTTGHSQDSLKQEKMNAIKGSTLETHQLTWSSTNTRLVSTATAFVNRCTHYRTLLSQGHLTLESETLLSVERHGLRVKCQLYLNILVSTHFSTFIFINILFSYVLFKDACDRRTFDPQILFFC